MPINVTSSNATTTQTPSVDTPVKSSILQPFPETNLGPRRGRCRDERPKKMRFSSARLHSEDSVCAALRTRRQECDGRVGAYNSPQSAARWNRVPARCRASAEEERACHPQPGQHVVAIGSTTPPRVAQRSEDDLMVHRDPQSISVAQVTVGSPVHMEVVKSHVSVGI